MDSNSGAFATSRQTGRTSEQTHEAARTSTTVMVGSAMDAIRPPTFGRGMVVSVVSAAAVFALAIMASGGTPESTGVPMTETTSPLFWGLALLFIAFAGFGAQYAEVTADRAALALGQPRRRESMPTAWAVPVIAVLSAILMVATYHNRVMLAAGPAIAFFGVSGALLARDLLDDVTEATQRTAATIHTLVIHGVAFIGLSAVYMNKMSNLVGGPLVAIIAGALILESMQRNQVRQETRVVLGGLGGLLMLQIMIALSWWPAHGWTGGAVLIVCFFALCGITTAGTSRERLNPRDLVGYLVFSLVALTILAFTI